MRIRESTPRARVARLSEVLHLEAYDDDGLIVTQADGDQAMIGRVYAAEPLVGSGSEFANVVINLFKTVADGSVISVSQLCVPDHDAAAKLLRGKTHGNDTLHGILRRQSRLLERAKQQNWQPDSPPLSTRRIIIALSVPTKSVTSEALQRARAMHRDFSTQLHSVGFHDARALSVEEVVELYRQLGDPLGHTQPAELDPTVELRDQVYGPDEEWDFTDEQVGRLGKTWCAGVGVKWFPASVNHGLMNMVIGAPFNVGPAMQGGGDRIRAAHMITTVLRVADQRKENERVERAISSRLNAQALPFRLGFEDSAAVLKDLQILEKRCMTGESEKYVYASTHAFVFSPTRELALEARGAVRGHWQRLGFDPREIGSSLLPRYAQALPLNFSSTIANKLECETVMPSGAAACLLPLYGDATGNVPDDAPASGVPFITRRGSAYWLDIFRTAGGFNGLIAAANGSGKTVAAQWLMACNLAEGAIVVAFDNGRSMLKTTAALGGEFVDFEIDALKRPSLNPFTGLDDAAFEEDRQGIVSLLMLMCYGPGELPEDGARIALDEAVVAAYGQKQDRAEITGVIDALSQIAYAAGEVSQRSQVMTAAINLVARLRAFMESPSRGGFFRGPATLDMKAQLTVFDVVGLEGDPHLKQVVTFFAINHTMSRLAKREPGTPALLVFDEAADHLRDPRTAAALEGLYRKGRKTKTATWIITQSLMDMAQSRGGAAGQIVLSQSYWKIVMRQDESDIGAAEREGLLDAFSNDPYFARMVRDVTSVKGRFSELLIMAGRNYEVVRLYVDRFVAGMLSSEGAERDKVYQLMKGGMDATDAVAQVVRDIDGRRRKAAELFFASMHIADDEERCPRISPEDLVSLVRDVVGLGPGRST